MALILTCLESRSSSRRDGKFGFAFTSNGHMLCVHEWRREGGEGKVSKERRGNLCVGIFSELGDRGFQVKGLFGSGWLS